MRSIAGLLALWIAEFFDRSLVAVPDIDDEPLR
jgi:hypothetical protein